MADTKKYYHNIDADGNKIINFLFNPLTTAQRTAVGLTLGPADKGYGVYDTDLDVIYYWDGTAWVSSVVSVGLTMPSAFSVAGSPITSSGTFAVTGAGNVSQYVRGDGSLADFPGTGGGSSVSYYLNGSINQGVFGGNTYYQMSKTPIVGLGTNFSIAANGYIAQFITDVGDPSLLNIPSGSWNVQMYMSANLAGGSPSFYVELYKYDGVAFTLIADNSATPEFITGGTNIDLYYTSVAVPATTLTITDRLVIRVYVNNSGRTITMHTENTNFCQVVTTFSTGLTAINSLTAQVQFLNTGTTGTDFNIASSGAIHTFNLPTASAVNRGALSNTDWSTFNAKQDAISLTTIGNSGAATFIGTVLNVPNYTLSGLGGVPTSRQLTINGIAYDLSADRSWSVGTVTSVAALTLGTTGTDLSSSVANGTTTPVITLNVPTASATNRGALSSSDWTTFNNKVTSLSAGTGISIGGTTTVPIVTNTAPDQTVVLSNGTGISVTGTYPNFTITNTSPSSGGTVTSIATSSPITGGTITNTGTIGITQSGTLTDGYLSATDWNTFNNKVDELDAIAYAVAL